MAQSSGPGLSPVLWVLKVAALGEGGRIASCPPPTWPTPSHHEQFLPVAFPALTPSPPRAPAPWPPAAGPGQGLPCDAELSERAVSSLCALRAGGRDSSAWQEPRPGFPPFLHSTLASPSPGSQSDGLENGNWSCFILRLVRSGEAQAAALEWGAGGDSLGLGCAEMEELCSPPPFDSCLHF